VLVPLLVASCSENKLAGPGGDCFQVTDCEDGLVCVPAPTGDGRRVCSSDVTGIQITPDVDAQASDGNRPDASPNPDAAPNDASTPPDANVPDTRPPPDTGTDTGTD